MVSQTWASPNFNWFRIDWPASPPFTRTVPLLRSLYLLSVNYRILFKISLMTYKAIHEKQPVYLHSMLDASLPSRLLRSNKGISLSVPRVNTNSSAKAFHYCAPSLWNNLPLSVHSAISVDVFKKHLKTQDQVDNKEVVLIHSTKNVKRLLKARMTFAIHSESTLPSVAGDFNRNYFSLSWVLTVLRENTRQ